MSLELITILMFACMLVLLVTGLPIVFCLGSIALVFAYFLWGPASMGIVTKTMMGLVTNFTLIACPLFVFMAYMIQYSGTGEGLYDAMHKWFGPFNGGLAVGTVIACTLIAAMSGLSATGTLAMGVIALPAMLKRGYDKGIAIGSIVAGGALGVLIPPSLPMIVYGFFSGVSIGRMFLGGILPGLLLSFLFIGYIVAKSAWKPGLCPAIPREMRASWRDKMISLKMVIIPILIVIGVLGSIFAGIATPTEAAAVGAFLSIISAVIYRQFTWKNLKQTSYDTMRISSMIMWIMVAGATFSSIYTGLGASTFIADTIESLEANRWFILIGMHITIFLLGMVLDPNGITIITVPIYAPIVESLGFDPLWFGVTYIVNLEMSYLTPPFGWNLFYIKSVAPEGITLTDIYRSVPPFVALQVIGLVIILIFPDVVTVLPNLAFKGS